MYAKFRCAPLRIKKALAILENGHQQQQLEWLFWDPPSGSKKYHNYNNPEMSRQNLQQTNW